MVRMNGHVPPRDDERGLWFDLTVDATSELARDTDQFAALMTVTARRSDHGAVTAATAVEVIIMDRSLSMHRGGKLRRAQEAVAAAIGVLSDDTYFAVIAGNNSAELVYPDGGTLRRATTEAKIDARNRVANLAADGGTAIGAWLSLANQVFGQVSDSVRHAVLYTDGINEHETQEALDAALNACRDQFVCDVRGVGVDWNPRELRRIAGVLQGEVEAIIDIANLRDDFTRLMAHAQAILVPEVYLRLKLDSRFRLESVKQIKPTENDLTGHRIPRDGGVIDVPLLAWGEESRDYLIVLRVNPGTQADDELRAARVDIIAHRPGGEPPVPCAEPAAVVVRWLPHRAPPPVNQSVTQAMDRVRLGAATRAGIDAYERDDAETALREFTIAVGIARSLGASGHLARLQRLVTIDDFGGVRLRPVISAADLRIVDTGTVNNRDWQPLSMRLHGPGSPDAAERAMRRCPHGHVTTAPGARYCEELGCDHEFEDDPSSPKG
jgi:Ca-activated chloride channel family protein